MLVHVHRHQCMFTINQSADRIKCVAYLVPRLGFSSIKFLLDSLKSHDGVIFNKHVRIKPLVTKIGYQEVGAQKRTALLYTKRQSFIRSRCEGGRITRPPRLNGVMARVHSIDSSHALLSHSQCGREIQMNDCGGALQVKTFAHRI